jgi:hypothetical protein
VKLFRALAQRKLTAVTYKCNSHISQPLTTEYPSEIAANLGLLKTSCLTSLAVYDISTNQAAENISDILLRTRKQLKVLRLGFKNVSWMPEVIIPNVSNESREETIEYMNNCHDEQLLPIVYKLLKANDPLQLRTLELFNCGRFNIATWLKAFDFCTIEDFYFLNPHYYSEESAENMWRVFHGLGIYFRKLNTHCEAETFDGFISSFRGLQELMLYYKDKAWNHRTDLSSHFDTLRVLLITQELDADDNITRLKSLIQGCPNLEELGYSIIDTDQVSDNLSSHCISARLFVTFSAKFLFLDAGSSVGSSLY